MTSQPSRSRSGDSLTPPPSPLSPQTPSISRPSTARGLCLGQCPAPARERFSRQCSSKSSTLSRSSTSVSRSDACKASGTSSSLTNAGQLWVQSENLPQQDMIMRARCTSYTGRWYHSRRKSGTSLSWKTTSPPSNSSLRTTRANRKRTSRYSSSLRTRKLCKISMLKKLRLPFMNRSSRTISRVTTQRGERNPMTTSSSSANPNLNNKCCSRQPSLTNATRSSPTPQIPIDYITTMPALARQSHLAMAASPT